MGVGPHTTGFADPQLYERLAGETLEREIRSVDQSGFPKPVQAVLVHGVAAGPLSRPRKAPIFSSSVPATSAGSVTSSSGQWATKSPTMHPCPFVIVRPDQQ